MVRLVTSDYNGEQNTHSPKLSIIYFGIDVLKVQKKISKILENKSKEL